MRTLFKMSNLCATQLWVTAVSQLWLTAATQVLLTAAAAAAADHPALPDIFSSVTELSKLVVREREFLRGLDQLATQLETNAQILRAFYQVSKFLNKMSEGGFFGLKRHDYLYEDAHLHTVLTDKHAV